MSHAALTAKYRPQTFSQVAGQDTLKTILSRASLEGKVAPAYLFSGTRGVGKTTLARIFAKALNCRSAPAAEPCNQCDQCRAVTMGSAVDVVEIDGASNRGIDDVRWLKEVVGYAPMEGGYKIFIIDEAHMLSREAFNALLKTLEEPPAKVTFIMATTEPHKFPATIISRCQHYVFKPLPENALVDHLAGVLEREGVDFEQNAVRLIARRGSGSVRDSMSLLGQVLALGAGRLTEESARGVLGLAGREAFMSMMEAFKTGDCLALSNILRGMLDQGLDMGFFLREISSLWRNMFMLRQSGEAALSAVDLPENEASACLESSRDFSLQHIHACWQMTVEGQRRVLTSLEPALALELLLLNLAMLPRLLSLESISAMSRKGGGPADSGSGRQGTPDGSRGASAQAAGRTQSDSSERSGPADTRQLSSGSLPQRDGSVPVKGTEGAQRRNPAHADPAGFSAPRSPESFAGVEVPHGSSYQRMKTAPKDNLFKKEEVTVVESKDARLPGGAGKQPLETGTPAPDNLTDNPEEPLPNSWAEAWSGEENDAEESLSPPAGKAALPTNPSSPEDAAPVKDVEWEKIFSLAEECNVPPWIISLLRRTEAVWNGNSLVLKAHDGLSAERLGDVQALQPLERLLAAWCGTVPKLDTQAPSTVRKSRNELQDEVMRHPLVKEMQNHFGARIVDYGQMR